MSAVQWQVSADGGATWAGIPGATQPSYSFTATLGDDGKQYRAVFAGRDGPVTTAAAKLGVGATASGPVVTAQPSGLTIEAGRTASFEAEASGTPTPLVRWQVSSDGGASWTDLVTAATSRLYSFTTRAADSGKMYRAVFLSSAGTAVTDAAALTVNVIAAAPAVITNPTDQVAQAGQAARFTAVAEGTPAPAAQWQVSTDGGSLWEDVAGATLPTYGLIAAPEDSGKHYRAVFTNSQGTATSNSAMLFVGLLPGKVICGQTITTDTTLDSDLACPSDSSYALAFGASNITLDLGGHVLSGPSPAGAPGLGILSNGFNGITIRNGSIRDFDAALVVRGAHGATIGDISISNRSLDQNRYINGLTIANSSGVSLRDSQFDFSAAGGRSAVDIYASEVSVDSITVRGGLGVNFSMAGSCDPANGASTGEVLNSRMAGSGVRLVCGSGVRVAGNDFDCAAPGYCIGVSASGPLAGTVTGLRVDGNRIRNAYVGIDFQGVAQSAATNNTISGSTGWGIALRQTQGGGGWATYPPNANSVSENTTWGSSTDLYDDDTGTGNVWARNVCATRQGAGIAACGALTVITNPADLSVVAGSPASFSASATYAGWPGSPPPVKWQMSADGGSSWRDVAGAAQSTYTFTASASDSGKQYRAVFTGSLGTATTAPARLTIAAVASAPVVTVQPASQSLQAGERVRFSAAAGGTPSPAVRWQVSRDGGARWVDLVTGADGPVYSFLTADSDSGKQYRAVFSNAQGSVATEAAALVVNARSVSGNR
jgi:hypothetical protein